VKTPRQVSAHNLSLRSFFITTLLTQVPREQAKTRLRPRIQNEQIIPSALATGPGPSPALALMSKQAVTPSHPPLQAAAPLRKFWRGSLLASAAVLMSGCGGGSAADPVSTTPVAASTTSGATTGTSTGTTAGTTTGTTSTTSSTTLVTQCSTSQFQAQVMAAINARRAAAQDCGSNGSFAATTALSWNTQLFSAAAAHTTDMASHLLLSHAGTDGSTMGQRITSAGYSWSRAAENIAMGYASIDAVIAGWIASPAH